MGEHVVENSGLRMLEELETSRKYLSGNMDPYKNKTTWRTVENNKNHLKPYPSIYVQHMSQIINTPWGTECTVDGNDFSETKIKFYSVRPLHQIPLATHKYRSEHIVIIKGIGEFTIGEDNIISSNNSHVFIPRCISHTVKNISNDKYLEFYEIQNGIKDHKGNYNLSDFDM